jgi:hypothetical protein
LRVFRRRRRRDFRSANRSERSAIWYRLWQWSWRRRRRSKWCGME